MMMMNSSSLEPMF